VARAVILAPNALDRSLRASRVLGRLGEAGQSLVEFSLVLIPFMLLLMGVFDLGRGIYMYNGAAQAAREIARSASVDIWKGATVGNSSETQAVKATQKALVPGLKDSGIQISCVDVLDAPKTCQPGTYVRVRISIPYTPVTPLLGLVGPFNLVAVSHLEIS
jgi:Flp pilus assembly protein TadG